MKGSATLVVAAIGVMAGAGGAFAEPLFLRQHTRCTTCHFSPTGGGLLTPYGRSLSREVLASLGRSGVAQPAGREHEFLFGLLGDTLGPVSVGVDLRPAHLDIDSAALASTRDFLMNAEVAAAFRHGNWTWYGELGRQSHQSGPRAASFEHWGSYKTEAGFGVRAGRFLPAYGIRLADHTTFTRALLELDKADQVYGLELSFTGDRHLLQVSAGPGYADSFFHDDGRRGFTATGRWQVDLRPHTVLVASGLFRDASQIGPRRGAAGLALGIAPTSRLSLWTEVDASLREGTTGQRAYILVGDAAFEVYRGVWLKLSPQLHTEFGDASAGVRRIAVGLDLLPRTHFNLVLSYYDDHDRRTDRSTKTLLAQLHLYL